jgi:hypothetical protein
MAIGFSPETGSRLYKAQHKLTRKIRGIASARLCEACPEQAHDWATLHGHDGADPEDYFALCRSCHLVYDFEKAGEARAAGAVRATARSLVVNAAAGYPGVSSGRATQAAAGYPRLAEGRATQAAAGYLGLAANRAAMMPADRISMGMKGMCRRWNINRGKPCTCGQHEAGVV